VSSYWILQFPGGNPEKLSDLFTSTSLLMAEMLLEHGSPDLKILSKNFLKNFIHHAREGWLYERD
jgi:hypothetical protein